MDQNQINELKSLLQSPGWAILDKWMDEQIQALINQLLGSEYNPDQDMVLKTKVQTLKQVKNKPRDLIKHAKSPGEKT